MVKQLLILILLFFPVLAFCQLRKNEVAIEFIYSDGNYVAFVQRGGQSSRAKVEIRNGNEIDALARNAALYDETNSRRAFELILAPLEHLLKRGDKVYLSPAGALHFINLEALTDKSGKRVFKRYKFYRVSDISTAVKDEPLNLVYTRFVLYGGMNYLAEPSVMNQHCWFLHSGPRQELFEDCEGWASEGIDFGAAEDGTRAGFSNLPNSRNEIKFIFNLNKWNAVVNTGPEATEERFRQDVRRNEPYVMHVSTHSFTTVQPLHKTYGLTAEEIAYKSCGLLFSGAGHTLHGEKLPYNLNDGLLYAEEIAGLDMHNCELMVVGACNTAFGRVSQDGVVGIQSAFKKAGAKTLLLTLWSVNDRATSFFMQQFYLHLSKGKSKYEAFRRARLDMIRSEDFNDPVYWAPFIMLD